MRNLFQETRARDYFRLADQQETITSADVRSGAYFYS